MYSAAITRIALSAQKTVRCQDRHKKSPRNNKLPHTIRIALLATIAMLANLHLSESTQANGLPAKAPISRSLIVDVTTATEEHFMPLSLLVLNFQR